MNKSPFRSSQLGQGSPLRQWLLGRSGQMFRPMEGEGGHFLSRGVLGFIGRVREVGQAGRVIDYSRIAGGKVDGRRRYASVPLCLCVCFLSPDACPVSVNARGLVLKPASDLLVVRGGGFEASTVNSGTVDDEILVLKDRRLPRLFFVADTKSGRYNQQQRTKATQ